MGREALGSVRERFTAMAARRQREGGADYGDEDWKYMESMRKTGTKK